MAHVMNDQGNTSEVRLMELYDNASVGKSCPLVLMALFP